MILDNDNDLLYDCLLHHGEKRSGRMKGYYVCLCDEQYIYFRPLKTRICPSCKRPMRLVSKVDEFEEARIVAYSGGLVRIEEREERRAV